MFSFQKLIFDLTQSGHVQAMTSKKFELMWSAPKQNTAVQWWYLGSDKYYHYLAERWGTSRRAWKIDASELIFREVDLHYPEGGEDSEVGVLLKEHNIANNLGRVG